MFGGRIAIVAIEGQSPYSVSRPIFEKKNDQETHEQFEERVWRQRVHAMPDGSVCIPGNCFAGAAHRAAQRLSIPIPGKNKQTYTKSFASGVYSIDPLVLPIKLADAPSEVLFLPANGRPGSGSRVLKRFVRIDEWGGKVTFQVLAGEITEDIFERVVRAAGIYFGVGRWTPQARGMYGRWDVKSIKWKEMTA